MVEQRCNSDKEFKYVCLTDLEIVVPSTAQDVQANAMHAAYYTCLKSDLDKLCKNCSSSA